MEVVFSQQAELDLEEITVFASLLLAVSYREQMSS